MKITDHLQNDYTEPIRDPIWGNIHLSDGLKGIVNTPEVQKLSRIKQLGPAFLVYPGATHSRLNHSFGVFYLGKRMITALIGHMDTPAFTLEGVKAFLCAALLHDLGHFPFAHSLKDLPLKEHEILTGEIILSSPLERLIRLDGTDPYTVASIIDEHLSHHGNNEVLFFRRLLSGVLDPDKLDYLSRDAYFCGVPYGFQDFDFIADQIVPHAEYGIAVRESGVTAVENVLFSKYLMYRSVYWHKTVRIATSMIKKAIILGITHGTVKPEELYGLDDEEFFQLFSHKEETYFQLMSRTSSRTLYKSVFEESFDESRDSHCELSDLSVRMKREAEIAGLLSRETGSPVTEDQVIIDIPEPISFEIDLPILIQNDFTQYRNAGSVFTEPVITGFQDSIRKLRLIVPPELSGIRVPWGELFP